MANKHIAYLRITSWKGISPGAHHYFGVIEIGEYPETLKEFDVSRTLTAQEAKDLNKIERLRQEPVFRYKEGETSKAFLSRAALIAAARKTFRKKVAPLGPKIMIAGEPYDLSPREVIASTGKFVSLKSELNGVYKADRAMYEECGDDCAEVYKELQKHWDRLIKDLDGENE